MNIKEAKEQIKNAMTAYFTKDELGNYIIPIERQRPVFLMGAPGIGKTAIMEQVASEMGVGLLSYSMTHHTRQSALGLPFIVHKKYGEMECDVSEYTMSEIIASVYDLMEETGIKEGILFLDEINCVSETLAPIMLQFLQYKIFGRHRVPDGWIVVTAGNPPEYNNSVREFDIVTWDRLKRIDVEPDFNVWKEYAYSACIHPSVISYLEIKPSYFYSVQTTVDGKSFVTARGWEDLSQMIHLYEKNNIPVNEKLVQQYLQNKKIAKSFAIYYDLFNKYKSDYQVDDILLGKASSEIIERAKKAKFDERLSLIGLLIDACTREAIKTMEADEIISETMTALKEFKVQTTRARMNPIDEYNKIIEKYRINLKNGKQAGTLSNEEQKKILLFIKTLEDMSKLVIDKNGVEAFIELKKEFNQMVMNLKARSVDTEKKMSNAFIFCETCYKDGQEILILLTELTSNRHTAKFISKFGCSEYYKYNKDLLFYDRQQEILSQLEALGEEFE